MPVVDNDSYNNEYMKFRDEEENEKNTPVMITVPSNIITGKIDPNNLEELDYFYLEYHIIPTDEGEDNSDSQKLIWKGEFNNTNKPNIMYEPKHQDIALSMIQVKDATKEDWKADLDKDEDPTTIEVRASKGLSILNEKEYDDKLEEDPDLENKVRAKRWINAWSDEAPYVIYAIEDENATGKSKAFERPTSQKTDESTEGSTLGPLKISIKKADQPEILIAEEKGEGEASKLEIVQQNEKDKQFLDPGSYELKVEGNNEGWFYSYEEIKEEKQEESQAKENRDGSSYEGDTGEDGNEGSDEGDVENGEVPLKADDKKTDINGQQLDDGVELQVTSWGHFVLSFYRPESAANPELVIDLWGKEEYDEGISINGSTVEDQNGDTVKNHLNEAVINCNDIKEGNALKFSGSAQDQAPLNWDIQLKDGNENVPLQTDSLKVENGRWDVTIEGDQLKDLEGTLVFDPLRDIGEQGKRER